jgi:hypothetical protein
MTITQLALEAALQKLDTGRNQGCWPLLSFGGKEADLDHSGCTGIQHLESVTAWCTLVIGGHKTVLPVSCEDAGIPFSEEDNAALLAIAEDAVVSCGYSGGFDDGCWTLYFTATLRIPMVGEDVNTAAEAIVSHAQESCQVFRLAMENVDKEIKLYSDAYLQRRNACLQ